MCTRILVNCRTRATTEVHLFLSEVPRIREPMTSPKRRFEENNQNCYDAGWKTSQHRLSRYTTRRIVQNKKAHFRRFLVKEPSQSENIPARKCYLYRSTRRTHSFLKCVSICLGGGGGCDAYQEGCFLASSLRARLISSNCRRASPAIASGVILRDHRFSRVPYAHGT